MNSEAILIYMIPVVVFALSGLVAFALGKNKKRGGMATLVLAWLGFTGALLVALEQSTGWDGLGYVVALMGLSAPIGAGLVIGGPIGWMKKEKIVHA